MNEDGPKYFMLAGPWTEKEKEESSQKITSLGGQMLDGVKWDQRCTHVITLGRPWTFKMSEKIMGALAAGRWVVTKRFLERSVSRNAWQKERPFLSDDLVLGHRRLWSETGSGVFRGMKVVFLMDDEKSEEVKKDVYTRIVVAGGGHVDPSFSLKTLKTTMPTLNQVTHVVVDPSILENKHPYFNEFKLWREYAATQNWPLNQLFYLHYTFFKDKIKEQVTEESWSIFNPETQASAKKLREPPNKKQRTSGGPPVVVISDGEASDDDKIQYLENIGSSRNTMDYEVINLDSDSDNETTINEIEVDKSLENQFSQITDDELELELELIHHLKNCEKAKNIQLIDKNETEKIEKNKEINGKKGKRINCTKCEKKFNKEQTFSAHMKTVHGENVLKMKKTEKIRQGEKAKNIQLIDKNETEKIEKNKEINGKKGKKINCTKCEKKFNKEQTFSAHMKTVHGENVLNMKKTEKIRQVNENENTYTYTNLTLQDRIRSLRSFKKDCSAQFSNN